MTSISASLIQTPCTRLDGSTKTFSSRFAAMSKQASSIAFCVKTKVLEIWRRFCNFICSLSCCKKTPLKKTSFSPDPDKSPSPSTSSNGTVNTRERTTTTKPSSATEIPPKDFRLFNRMPDPVTRHMLDFLDAPDVVRFGQTSKAHKTQAEQDSVWKRLSTKTFPRITQDNEDQIPRKDRHRLLARRINTCTFYGRPAFHVTYYAGITTIGEYKRKIAEIIRAPLEEVWLNNSYDHIPDDMLCSDYFRDYIDPADGKAHVPHPQVHHVFQMPTSVG